jgi:hypothetical protein
MIGIMGFLKSSLEFGNYLTQGICELMSCAVIAPTAFRYIRTEGSFLAQRKDNYSIAEGVGFGLGVFAGMSLDYVLLGEVFKQASSGDFFELGLIGATNLASGAFETGRFILNRCRSGD